MKGAGAWCHGAASECCHQVRAIALHYISCLRGRPAHCGIGFGWKDRDGRLGEGMDLGHSSRCEAGDGASERRDIVSVEDMRGARPLVVMEKAVKYLFSVGRLYLGRRDAAVSSFCLRADQTMASRRLNHQHHTHSPFRTCFHATGL